MAKLPWRYDHLTWPEIKAASARTPQPVVAIPIGAVEDHGAHMSISTDNDILEGMLAACGERAAGDLLVLPTIPFGLDEHHMDYPGTIAVDIETTMAYLTQVATSVARHGFTHILIVNGHGSNASICDLAARKVVINTGMICAATTVNAAVNPALVADVLDTERKGGWGSVGHACEYETAVMLHFHPERVDMSLAERDIGQLKLKYFNWDYPEPSAYSWQDWWSRFSRVGVCGDASAATPEFGKRMVDLTVERFVEMVREFRSIPIRPRVDHH
ncbi:MAG: creatininase family protein [Roseiflexaceae bacterium]